jgi:hypothetical protein
MNKLLAVAVGAATVFIAHSWARRQMEPVTLTQPDLTPGAWYCYYLGDYLTDFPDEQYTKACPVQWTDGEFVWATDTPEWDRDWFNAHGWEFPARWIPYEQLKSMPVEMQSVGMPK